MPYHRNQAAIEATKHQIEHRLHQLATASGLEIDALAWTAPSGTTTPRDFGCANPRTLASFSGNSVAVTTAD